MRNSIRRLERRFRSRTRRLSAVHAILIGAIAAGLAGAPACAAAEPPQVFDLFGIDWSPQGVQQFAQRYRAAILHNLPQTRQALPRVKQLNPSFVALMYREIFCTQEQETELGETVGPYAWILANHPDWFQVDANGERVEIPDYPGRWMMDFGNPEWRAYWIEHTLQDVINGGWDGVMADDVLTTIRAHDLPRLAGYENDAALQTAVTDFLSSAYQAFHQAGKLFIINASNTYDYPGLWDRWLQLSDGILEEHFAGEAWGWGPHVAERQLAAMRAANARGKWMFCTTYGPWSDRARMRTSLAAYLIGAGPNTVWLYRPVSEDDRPSWDVEWEGLGAPGNPMTNGNVIERPFERGYAALNLGSQPSEIYPPGKPVSVAPTTGTLVRYPQAKNGSVVISSGAEQSPSTW